MAKLPKMELEQRNVHFQLRFVLLILILCLKDLEVLKRMFNLVNDSHGEGKGTSSEQAILQKI